MITEPVMCERSQNARLEKFFAQAFGAIFESGLLRDPEFDLAEDQPSGTPTPFAVCGEEAITVVLGWDNQAADLFLNVATPLDVRATTRDGYRRSPSGARRSL